MRTIAREQSVMTVETLFRRPHAIVYDGERIDDPAPRLFDPEYWQQAGHVLSAAPGRGAALFLNAPFGPAVLRRYLRGGWAAKITRDRYLFTGLGRSRPFREFHLLRALRQRDLPVPEPLAALCTRSGLSYRGALLTRTIPNTVALAEALSGGLAAADWWALGEQIARLHGAGVLHADLNARNILAQPESGKFYFVDFDRGLWRPGRRIDGSANLARLKRSLVKLWPPKSEDDLEARWSDLMRGYRA